MSRPRGRDALPVLIVEDDGALREALTDTLGLAGWDVLGAADGEAALALLAKYRIGLVVTDVQMAPMDGRALLAESKRRHPEVPVLLMTAWGVIEHAVDAMRQGACGYITKPFEPEEFVAQVVQHQRPPGIDPEAAVVAEDPATRAVLDLARRVAPTDATVLITGESGTGKEVLARFVHRHSPRAARPFVAINCAAIPDALLESTLFGHERGAFTGAVTAAAGKFEQADGGTLLLDEISEMPLGLQAKLLRVLQEREVERIGARAPLPVDIRVIATSNRDMAAEARDGRFREDLYYRLAVFPLHQRPLRERPGDILPIARRVLARGVSGADATPRTLAPDAEAALVAHRWPGNVRELENVLQRAMILAAGATIGAGDLALVAAAPAPAASGESPGAASGAGAAPPSDLRSLERRHILDTLAAVDGVRTVAAQRLGMSERTLRYKLQQLREEGVAIPESRVGGGG
jgi:two-component system response regulator FlrC